MRAFQHEVLKSESQDVLRLLFSELDIGKSKMNIIKLLFHNRNRTLVIIIAIHIIEAVIEINMQFETIKLILRCNVTN